MKEILHKLIELQKIDERLLQIVEIKGDFPEKVKVLNSEYETLTKEIENQNIRVDEIEKELRSLNNNIEDDTSKLKKFKDQLYLVKTNKEYDALLNEIDTKKNSITKAENTILNLEEENINLVETVKSKKLKLEGIASALEKSESALKKALSKTEVEERKLLKQRAKFVKTIDSKYLNGYDRFRKANDGYGIISVARRACGNCFYSLPPQTNIEIKQNNQIISCPSCGIFLFWDPDDE